LKSCENQAFPVQIIKQDQTSISILSTIVYGRPNGDAFIPRKATHNHCNIGRRSSYQHQCLYWYYL